MAEGTKSSTGGGFLLKIRGPREFFGGLALIAVAAIALWASSSLPDAWNRREGVWHGTAADSPRL